MRANQTEENSSIIGRKLVDSEGAQQSIQDSEKHRLAFIAEKAGKQKRWKQTTKKWKKLKEQIEQLRHEITNYKQAEARLKNQLANLTAANEALQREIAEYNQAKEQTEQRVTGLEAADKSLQPEITESGQTEQMQEENTKKTKQPRRLSRHVDAEQLKAIAEFAKQLRGRYRHISEQSPDPAISGKGDSA
jgi:chromosome segregation ATPase